MHLMLLALLALVAGVGLSATVAIPSVTLTPESDTLLMDFDRNYFDSALKDGPFLSTSRADATALHFLNRKGIPPSYIISEMVH